MASKKLLILNKESIKQKITRIAYQILEDCIEEESLVIAGIADNGYTLASRLKDKLEEISSFDLLLVKINLDKKAHALDATMDEDVSKAANKVVILVDDVLNSGRTLAYGLGLFFDIPLKKLRTAVLVDRSHHKFPISSDYAGIKLSTVLKEHVSVVFEENEEAAYLL